MTYSTRRDVHGFAVAITRDGRDVLHLVAGSERNEREAQGVVDRLNSTEQAETKPDDPAFLRVIGLLPKGGA